MSNSSDSDSQTIVHDPMTTMLRGLERINRKKHFAEAENTIIFYVCSPKFFISIVSWLVGHKGS